MNCVSSKLNVEMNLLNIHTPFADYGFTSVMAVELAKELESWVGRQIAPTISWQFSSIGALAGHLLEDPRDSEAKQPSDTPTASLAELSDEAAEAMLLDELAQLRN
jgi:acyl carrier protein